MENVPNLSGLSDKEKAEFINDFIQLVAKQSLSVFVAVGLETHIEATIVNDADGSVYKFSLIKT